MSQFVEIQTEYIQINTGAVEKHQRKLKTEGCECWYFPLVLKRGAVGRRRNKHIQTTTTKTKQNKH